MQSIDLMIATDWEYDRAFTGLLAEAARHIGLSVMLVRPGNLSDTIHRIAEKELRVCCLFDRASDTSPEFLPLQRALRRHGARIYDPIETLEWASDKATMHLEFIQAGLHTPYTLILPPHEEVDNQTLSVGDLAHLGRPFIIKPANTTGGGIGVVEGAETLHDVLKARLSYREDKYLLQEKVIPLERDGRRFWFRGFHVFGCSYASWWDDRTHRYTRLDEEEIRRYALDPLFDIMQRIASVCRLHFFSSEIVARPAGDFVVVDYVNESCDMRIQSAHPDGVPDALVEPIICQIVQSVSVHIYDGQLQGKSPC